MIIAVKLLANSNESTKVKNDKNHHAHGGVFEY